MAQSINLVPQSEKREQAKKRVIRASTVFTIFLLLCVLGAGGYLYYQQVQLETQLTEHKSNIAGLRADINELADIEIVARNLDKKYKAVSSILTSRSYYSKLFAELEKRVPPYVQILDFSMSKTSEVSISGSGDNYIAISSFLANLGRPSKEVATEGMEGLFTDVTLNSVQLENRNNNVKYFITSKYTQGDLRK